MTDKDKLTAIIDTLCLGNKAEFARAVNTSPQTITNWINRGISKDGLLSINKAFPSLNREWLLTGKGEMLKQPVDEIREATQEELEELRNEIEAGRASVVPLIPASAFAGSVNGISPESIKREQCELITSPVAGAEYAIPITGDSMEPDYPDGSTAYIKRINEQAFIPWGHVVILDTENGAFIKRILPDENDKRYVWAYSINPNYPPMHIPKSSIFRIFRVLGTSRIFTTM